MTPARGAPAGGPPILAVERVTKRFGALRAVDQVSFRVEAGQVFGIAGPNGSGKSTLFNLITSIPYPADDGRVLYHGRRIERLQPHRICRLGIARTFQKDADFPTLTVRENVRLAVVYGRRDGAGGDQASTVETALDMTGVATGDRGRPAAELSVFTRKRVMLASALATRPDLLLLDEPASGLSKPEVAELTDLIRRINADGITVLLIEHVLPLLLSVSQRLLVLNQGRVLTEGTPDAVIRDERVIEAYLGSRGRDAVRAA